MRYKIKLTTEDISNLQNNLINSYIENGIEFFRKKSYEESRQEFLNVQNWDKTNETAKIYLDRIFIIQEEALLKILKSNSNEIENFIQLEKFYISSCCYMQALDMFKITNYRFENNHKNYTLLKDLFNEVNYQEYIKNNNLANHPTYIIVKEDLECYEERLTYLEYKLINEFLKAKFCFQEKFFNEQVKKDDTSMSNFIQLENFYINSGCYKNALKIFQIANHKILYDKDNYEILSFLFATPNFQKYIQDKNLVNYHTYLIVKEDLEVYKDIVEFIFSKPKFPEYKDGRWIEYVNLSNSESSKNR
ncbi:MAG: hypothetical protein ACK4OM_05380 [Alphaproteobacteria bacterium]